MPRNKVWIEDDRYKELFKIHMHFYVAEANLLSSTLEKVIRMSLSNQPQIPDFTAEELEVAGEVCNQMKNKK